MRFGANSLFGSLTRLSALKLRTHSMRTLSKVSSPRYHFLLDLERLNPARTALVKQKFAAYAQQGKIKFATEELVMQDRRRSENLICLLPDEVRLLIEVMTAQGVMRCFQEAVANREVIDPRYYRLLQNGFLHCFNLMLGQSESYEINKALLDLIKSEYWWERNKTISDLEEKQLAYFYALITQATETIDRKVFEANSKLAEKFINVVARIVHKIMSSRLDMNHYALSLEYWLSVHSPFNDKPINLKGVDLVQDFHVDLAVSAAVKNLGIFRQQTELPIVVMLDQERFVPHYSRRLMTPYQTYHAYDAREISKLEGVLNLDAVRSTCKMKSSMSR